MKALSSLHWLHRLRLCWVALAFFGLETSAWCEAPEPPEPPEAPVQLAPLLSQALVVTSGNQSLWSHLRVQPEAFFTASPEEAHHWFHAHPGIRLAHEQSQMGGVIPRPHWAILKVHNPSPATLSKVLVYPSTTQDAVEVWRKTATGWALLPRGDEGSGGFEGALQPHWRIELPPGVHQDWLIRIDGHNRVRFPLLLMDPMDHSQLEKNGVALSVTLLVVPVALTLVSLTYWPRHATPQLWLLLAMAVAEWVSMSWVSGLGSWIWPLWSRWDWALLGQSAYAVLIVLGAAHAALVLRHILGRWVQWLIAGFLACWLVGLPMLFAFHPWSLRFALIWVGGLEALVLVGLALWAVRRQATPALRQVRLIWSIYLASALVYQLHFWLDWSVQVTLWANVIQGSAVSVVFAWAIWQGVMARRDEVRAQLQHWHERQVWWAMQQHDLWQPLNSIRRGVNALLEQQASTNDDWWMSLQLATESLDDFAQAQLTPLIDVATQRSDASDHPVVDLQSALRRLTQEHRPMANRRAISLRLHLLPVWARLNEGALRRLIRNLLHNALAHTPEGGRILLALRSHGGHAWLWVVDTGEGMAQDVLQAHLQSAHAQAASERMWQASSRRGWGLGLYSAHHLARVQGWRVHMQSRIGHGTTVRVNLGRLTAAARAD